MARKTRLAPVALGLAFGVAWGVLALFTGLAAWLFGWGTAFVELIASLYIGYAPTLAGSVIGALWALADGFIAGVVIAWLYNKCSGASKEDK
jgi:hypothetical protein